jgi:hypothetical protein
VLDPSLPAPSYDCVADQATKSCVAISGTVNGVSLDRHCARPDAPPVLLKNPDAWPASCPEQDSAGQGWMYQVHIPVREPGNFEYRLKAGDDFVGADVIAVYNGFGVDFQASNLEEGAGAGTIVISNPAPGARTAYGTFRAKFGAPKVTCNSSYATKCAPAQVTGTFRVESLPDL